MFWFFFKIHKVIFLRSPLFFSKVTKQRLHCDCFSFTRFFYKQHFFSTQPQSCLTLSWIELQMLLRCCLIHISIIMLGHFLYLLYLCPCLDLCRFLDLFMSYLYDLLFIFIFIIINRISYEYRHTCSFAYFLEYVLLFLDNNAYKKCEKFSNSEGSASGCCSKIERGVAYKSDSY